MEVQIIRSFDHPFFNVILQIWPARHLVTSLSLDERRPTLTLTKNGVSELFLSEMKDSFRLFTKFLQFDPFIVLWRHDVFASFCLSRTVDVVLPIDFAGSRLFLVVNFEMISLPAKLRLAFWALKSWHFFFWNFDLHSVLAFLAAETKSSWFRKKKSFSAILFA